MKIPISEANHDDLEAVVTLENASFPDPWPRYLFEEVFSHPEQFLVVAKAKDKVLGYIIFWHILQEVHILNICVDIEARRKGIAQTLLKDCLKREDHQKVSLFTLEVREGNLPAQKLYAKMGFKETHIRKNYYPNQEDAVVMTLVTP